MFLDTIIVIKLFIEIIIFTHLIIQIIYNKNKSKKLFIHFFMLILIITLLNKIQLNLDNIENIQRKEALYANIILIL